MHSEVSPHKKPGRLREDILARENGDATSLSSQFVLCWDLLGITLMLLLENKYTTSLLFLSFKISLLQSIY